MGDDENKTQVLRTLMVLCKKLIAYGANATRIHVIMSLLSRCERGRGWLVKGEGSSFVVNFSP